MSSTDEVRVSRKAYPGADNLPVCAAPESPVLPITFRRGAERISYFSLVTTIGTPQTVTAQELRLECMFPIKPANIPQRTPTDIGGCRTGGKLSGLQPDKNEGPNIGKL